MQKQQVRRLAEEHKLPVFDKKDSTGICFIGERKFSAFLRQYLAGRPGEIRSLDDEVLGTHQGLMFYTIGQRQGLGIGGRSAASGEPWYVVDKDMETNLLRVAQGVDHPALYGRGLSANRMHWISGSAPEIPKHCTARIRYQQEVQGCVIVGADAQEWRVEFNEPQRAITPGQSVVFYNGEECLGGGVIMRGISS